MQAFLKLLDLQLTLLVYILLGFWVGKKQLISDQGQKSLMKLLIYVFLPLMVFNSFKSVNARLLALSFQAMLAACVIYTVTSVLAYRLYRSFPAQKGRVMGYGTLVNNAGFAGLPIAMAIYGSAGAVMASVYLAPHRLFMWTVGLAILEGKPVSHFDKKTLWRLLTNPSIIAVFLGLLRGLLEIGLPSFVDRALGGISGLVAPLAMIMIGCIISQVNLATLFEKPVLYYCFIRLIAIPFIVMFTMKGLGLDPQLTGVVTILTGMPIGTPTTVLAAQYQLDVAFAAKLTFLSIVLSIFTVPLVLAFI